jgi:hypothetical protein
VVILVANNCKTNISSHHNTYILHIFVAVTTTMEDGSDPTLAVRFLSITRNQDLSDWAFCSSDQKSLRRNLVESGITTREFSTRHCLA